MTITEKIWREYLEACGWKDTDCVMYLHNNVACTTQWSKSHIENVAISHFRYGDTPLRIFTPDGKTQKGPDFDEWIKGRKSKRERLLEYLPCVFSHSLYGPVITYETAVREILKICEVDDV